MIGGLLCATIATLVFVPVLFSLAHRRERRKPAPAADLSTGDFVHAE